MTNTVPLRTVAWATSAAVWCALVALAFTSHLKLPDIQLPQPADGPTLEIQTTPPKPVPQKTSPTATPPRPSTIPDAEPVLVDFPMIDTVPDPQPSAGAPPSGVTGPLAPFITNPRWLSRPGAREFERFYPARAREREREGRVALDCLVGADGAIACTVARETPEGWGFGDAALKMAPSFRIAPRMEDGRATEGGQVRVDIAFRLGG